MFDKQEIKECLKIARSLETPAYIYSKRVIGEKYRLLKENLPENFSIHYAVKANPYAPVVNYLGSLGAGADISSGGELELSLKEGISPDKIGFAGPGKTQKEITDSIINNIASINVESFQELLLINETAGLLGKIQPFCIRVNPKEEILTSGIRMGGGAKPFGIDEEDLESVFSILRDLKNVLFKGIHIFAGSQILDYQLLLKYFEGVLKIALSIHEKYQVPIEIINFGGGFGIPYFKKEEELDILSFGKGIKKLFGDYELNNILHGTRYIIESGRYLVGASGIYITKVLYRKNSKGKEYIVTEGGMNHHLSAAGLLGSILRQNYIIKVLNKLEEHDLKKYDIVGPLCTPMDRLAVNIDLPDVEPGDFLGVFNSGAYGYSASPLYFLSHTFPKQEMI